MPELALRAAAAADLPSLVRLTRAFYDEDGFSTPTAHIERHLALLLAAPQARLCIADVAGRPVGFALTTAQLVLESGVVAELQDLYVEPASRRHGIAAALIADAEAWSRTQSAALLEVVVAPNGRDVSQLLAYYRARGFADEGRRLLTRPL